MEKKSLTDGILNTIRPPAMRLSLHGSIQGISVHNIILKVRNKTCRCLGMYGFHVTVVYIMLMQLSRTKPCSATIP